MKKILTEILFDIKKSPLLFSLLAIQLTIYFCVCLFGECIRKQIGEKQSKIVYEQQELQYYTLTDNLVGDYEKTFFANKDAIAKLKIMYSMLKNDSRFTYIETYNNPIVLIGEGIVDKLLYRYEEGDGEKYRGVEEGQIYNEVKCFFVSSNVGNVFEIECQQGALWEEAEKNNSPIPIVLGSDYFGIFQVGDCIEGISPIYGKVIFEVYGILKEGQYVSRNHSIINLDRYVLTPLQDEKNLPEDKAEEREQKLLYLLKINGTIVSTLSAEEVQSIVQEICDISDVCPASAVNGASNAQSYVLNDSLQNILKIFEHMINTLDIFALTATVLYVLIKINKSKKYYGILLLNGFSFREVCAVLFGTVTFSLVIADIIAGMIYYAIAPVVFYTRELFVSGVILSNIQIMIITFFISYVKLKKINISACIGG